MSARVLALTIAALSLGVFAFCPSASAAAENLGAAAGCDNMVDYRPGPDGCPGKCKVDDDGNGLVDDVAEICPCFRCAAGPRAGKPCAAESACNPSGGTANKCARSADAKGLLVGYGDDACGAGPPTSLNAKNAGKPGVNNYEDYQAASEEWQKALGLQKPDPKKKAPAK